MQKSALYDDHIDLLGTSDLLTYTYKPEVRSDTLSRIIAENRRNRNITLVLGAGISYPSKLPGWLDLIEAAAKGAFANTAIPEVVGLAQSSGLSPISQVRLFEKVMGMKTSFRKYLVAELYKGYTDGTPHDNLQALAEFILGDDTRPAICMIITYNFDDLLERAIRFVAASRGLTCAVASIFSTETYRSTHPDSTIKVFHPHGFLPFGADFSDGLDNPIVFAEEDYHEHFLSHAYWANTLQMAAFSASNCLFVGLSFTDGNVRRLLDYTKGGGAKHAAITALQKNTVSDPKTRHIENYILEKDRESLGIRTLWVPTHDDIPDLIRHVMSL